MWQEVREEEEDLWGCAWWKHMEEMEEKMPSLTSPSGYAWTCHLSPQPEEWGNKKTEGEKTQIEKISEPKSSYIQVDQVGIRGF